MSTKCIYKVTEDLEQMGFVCELTMLQLSLWIGFIFMLFTTYLGMKEVIFGGRGGDEKNGAGLHLNF